MKKVTVIGSGSWGTALAVMLAKNDHEIMIWSRRQDAVDELINERKNERYLPGIVIPENIKATTDREAAVEGAEIIILAVGTLTAFLVSVLAIRTFISYIQKHDFAAFGWYRIVLGALVAAYFLFVK